MFVVCEGQSIVGESKRRRLRTLAHEFLEPIVPLHDGVQFALQAIGRAYQGLVRGRLSFPFAVLLDAKDDGLEPPQS